MMLGSFQIVAFIAFVIVAEFQTEAVNKNAGSTKRNNAIKSSSNLKIRNTIRIVQGDSAALGDYPFQVAILSFSPTLGTELLCGGTVISTNHILTAASCVSNIGCANQNLDKTLYFLFGTTVLNQINPNTDISCKSIFIHPNYDINTREHNIAIISLSNPVKSGIIPVKLEPYTPSEFYLGMDATIVGWGKVSQILYPDQLDGISETLRYGKVSVVSNKDCGIMYHRPEFFPKNVLLYTKPDQFLCIASPVGVSTCQTDQGGPLLMNGVQIGVSSFAAGCADPRYPGIFTRVGRYSEWIQNIVTNS